MAGQPTPTQSRFEQYAAALAATAFSDKKFISGTELLKALPEKQLNLLILFRLKEKWEDEAIAIRSPYFDYEAPTVKDAQQKFLNVLSQYIKLDQDTYAYLVSLALLDAWQLASKPTLFLSGLAEKLANPSITVEQMQALSKYIVYHSDLLKETLKDMTLTGRTSFLKGDFFQQIQRIEDRMPSTDREKHLLDLTYFLSTLGVQDDDDVLQPELPKEEIETSNTSFFDFEIQQEATIEPEAFPLELPALDSIEDAEPWPEAAEESVQTDQVGLVEESTMIPPVVELPKPNTMDWKADSEAPQIAEKKTFDLFTSTTTDKEESLGDRLARENQSQGLHAKVASASAESLHGMISMGERFMIVEQLFGGEMAPYSLALSQINSLSTYETAIHYLWDEIAPKQSWNPESEAYKTLDAALRRKFAA